MLAVAGLVFAVGLAGCSAPTTSTTTPEQSSNGPTVASQSPEPVESTEPPAEPVAVTCSETVGSFPEALGSEWYRNASFPLIGDDVMDGLFEAAIPRGGCAYAAPDGASYIVIYESTGAWSRWDSFVQSIGIKDRNRDSGPWSTQTPSGRWIRMDFYLLTTDHVEMGRSGLSWRGSQFDENPLIVRIVSNG